MLRCALIVAALAVTAPQAWAAGPAAEKTVEGDSARAMDVLNLVAPVVRDGRLTNYLFVSARIQLAPGVDAFRTRDKGHFLRDALVKAVHRSSVAAADRDDQLDPAAAQALIGAVARQTLGANAVRSVEILDVASLKPARTARS